MMPEIDINCDMGESFGSWKMGNDEELIPYISSANVAGGYHAGDAHIMRKTVSIAQAHGVEVGIHCGFRDPEGFGRRYIHMTNTEVQDDLIYQLGALQGFASAVGMKVQHVKPHGALYMMAAQDRLLSKAIIEAVAKVDPTLILFCMEASETYAVAKSMGYPVASEFYIDREYGADGQIIFTRHATSLLDPESASIRALRAIKEGKVKTVDGKDIDIKADTLCLHGDSEGAPALSKILHNTFVQEGVNIVPISHIWGKTSPEEA